MLPVVFSKPHLLAIALLGSIVAPLLRAADARPEPIANAAAVLSLTGEQASRRLPISISGIVTAAEPDWRGQFFVQDETGGVFVENLSNDHPVPGDVVTITGVSQPGAFAPIISEPHWKVVGTAPLPSPKKIAIERLESGVEDGQRVEIAGVIRAVRIDGTRLDFDLAVGGYRLEIRAPLTESPPDSLVAAYVRVRGTAASHYNAALRHLTSVAVFVPRAEDFTVLESDAANPFDEPVIPLNSVAQYRRGSGSGKRIHVRGVVTLQRIGEDVFLQDSTGGLRVKSAQIEPLAQGDEIDAVGFLEYENLLPILRDSTLHRSGHTATPIPPRAVLVEDVKRGLHNADLISLRGKILDRSTRPISRAGGNFSGIVTTWLLQGEGLGFTVEHEDRAEDPALASIPVGSTVDVGGVGFSEIDNDGSLKNLVVLLPSAASMRVVARPSWLTPERLLVGIGALAGVLILVVLWSLTVSRKNAALQEAQTELQDAHDTLEQKVVERSAQLQVEMTARKTAELQFKAVLAERTRLARDLHDTLEQTLTGIALQLDTTAKLFQRSPETSNRHLEFARNWLRQSQVELRRSIWDLRSRELEQFDLANALRQSAEHLVNGTDIQFAFATRGEKRRLPEVVEENVLRIGQEALTNIAKHAHATRVSIALDFRTDHLSLSVEDNGVGFVHPPTAPPGSDHFGLIGMAERAKRLSGRLTIDSSPHRGTIIAVEIPLESLVASATGPDRDPAPHSA